MVVPTFYSAHSQIGDQSTHWRIGSICKMAVLFSGAALLSACGGSSSDDTKGYIKFYNASSDSPGIYLTLDENLDEDEDDEFEQTF